MRNFWDGRKSYCFIAGSAVIQTSDSSLWVLIVLDKAFCFMSSLMTYDLSDHIRIHLSSQAVFFLFLFFSSLDGLSIRN